jgi:hypothetical protein
LYFYCKTERRIKKILALAMENGEFHDRHSDETGEEKKIVREMITLYCNGNHGTKKGSLCPECESLLAYSWQRPGGIILKAE